MGMKPLMKKKTVTERALLQRINRKLLQDDQMMKAARPGDQEGPYYVIDSNRNILLWHRVNIEKFGRKLGCLQEWETVTES